MLAVQKTAGAFGDLKFQFEFQPGLFSAWLDVGLNLYRLFVWAVIRRKGGGCRQLVSQGKPKYSLDLKIKLDRVQTIIRSISGGKRVSSYKVP